MKVAFLTLGCKVNFYETEQMMEQFQTLGFDVVDFQEKADIYIVNTCTVTNMADRKSRQMLHRAKKKNPDSLVVAVGCYVRAERQNLKRIRLLMPFSQIGKKSIWQSVLWNNFI